MSDRLFFSTNTSFLTGCENLLGLYRRNARGFAPLPVPQDAGNRGVPVTGNCTPAP